MWVLGCFSVSFCGAEARAGGCGSAGVDMTCGSGKNFDRWLCTSVEETEGFPGVVCQGIDCESFCCPCCVGLEGYAEMLRRQRGHDARWKEEVSS